MGIFLISAINSANSANFPDPPNTLFPPAPPPSTPPPAPAPPAADDIVTFSTDYFCKSVRKLLRRRRHRIPRVPVGRLGPAPLDHIAVKPLGPQLRLLVLEQRQLLPAKVVHRPVGGAVGQGRREHRRRPSRAPPIGRGRVSNPQIRVKGLARQVRRLELNDGRNVDGPEARIVSRRNVLERQFERAVKGGNRANVGSVGIGNVLVGIRLTGAGKANASRRRGRRHPVNHLLTVAEARNLALHRHSTGAGMPYYSGRDAIALRRVLHLQCALIYFYRLESI